MGDHRGIDLGQVFQGLGIVFLDQLAGRRAGGGNEIVVGAAFEQFPVFPGDGFCADGGLFGVVESKPGQRQLENREIGDAETGDEGRRDAGNHFLAGVQQDTDPIDLADDHLGVLGADGRTVAAQDAAVFENRGFTVLDGDSLDHALVQALVTVVALDCLGKQIRCHRKPIS